ncbi:hypothetical protein MSIMFB_00723 [Mycobacterium simulans]|uniref:Transmembrane protein n=1 Tax=Mycobacterium simulans TaxID=627089 RepID=A0A7Z7IIM9_9MYCO|nr:hypothetical protein [Mycobacterium simulans]SOJ53223.1 hypothetical protein MSIMFB_00723 [Mycobacterium simulans]
MTEPDSESANSEDSSTRQISVAELLARNGNVGAPAVSRRRRRRRGDSDAVTVAELTGEIPIIRDEHQEKAKPRAEVVVEPAPQLAPEPISEPTKAAYGSEPEPRWPRSEPVPRRASGPERSEYPRPLRHTGVSEAELAGQQSGAEHMNPDPVEHYGDTSVDVMDTEVRDVESAAEDSAYVRSYLQADEGTLFGGQSIADEVARRRGQEQTPALFEEDLADEAQVARRAPRTITALWHATVIVFQSILAVVFGAGLFIAFDQLWRWNSIVALVLSVLVILGLVVGVRVVRKTEDIASTLIAVAVGALITLGPLALLQSG